MKSIDNLSKEVYTTPDLCKFSNTAVRERDCKNYFIQHKANFVQLHLLCNLHRYVFNSIVRIFFLLVLIVTTEPKQKWEKLLVCCVIYRIIMLLLKMPARRCLQDDIADKDISWQGNFW